MMQRTKSTRGHEYQTDLLHLFGKFLMYDLRPHIFTLQLGFRLIFLCDKRCEGNLLEAITMLRRSILRDLEIAVPEITIRDNMDLEGGEYVLLANGQEIARGEVYPDFLAAFTHGNLGIEFLPDRPDVRPVDPASNRRVILIRPECRGLLETQGFVVADAIDLLTSHLSRSFLRFAHESTAYHPQLINGTN